MDIYYQGMLPSRVIVDIKLSDTSQDIGKNLGGKASAGQPSANVCNPVNAAIGNKFQPELDYSGAAHTQLELVRYYNSADSVATSFGKNWHGTYQHSLTQVSSSNVTVTRADGRVETFNLVSGTWQSDPDVTSRLSTVGSPQTGWQLVRDDDSIELYTLDGRLSSITTRAGLVTTLTYNSSNLLTTVTGPFGHTLTFTYDGAKRVNPVTDPASTVYTYNYDTMNNLVSVTYPDNKTRSYLYENTSWRNALTGITDENGNRYATYGYDAQGRATSTQHAGGADSATLVYNADGTSTVTNALGKAYTYAFTTTNKMVLPANISNQGCTCGSSAFTYDANGFMASRTDFNSNLRTYSWNSRGLELSRTEASGTVQARTISTVWDATYHLPSSVTEPNRTTAYTYDAKGNQLTKTETANGVSRTWTRTYNANGQVLTVNDPKGHATTYTYNATGGVATITNAAGQVTSITSYDANGRPLTIQDPNGLTTTLAYDVRGRLTSRTQGAETTTLGYDGVGNLTTVTLSDGAVLTMAYDAAHRLTGITDNSGNRIAYTLDALGGQTKVDVYDPTNQLRRTRSQVFDQFGRLASIIGAQNQTTTLGHDNNGNVTSVTDPLNHSSQLGYDALDRLVQSTDPTSAVTGIAYNANDLVTGVTDPRNLATSYQYNGFGDRTSTQSPDAGTSAKTYDAAGNVQTATDARGLTTTYSYDALNRLTGATFADSQSVTYQYDQGTYGKGQLTTMTDPAGTTSWSYDLHGRVLQKQQTIGTIVLTTTYTYDSATGNPLTVTYPSGRQLSYTYDSVSKKLTGIKVGTVSLVSGITYQPFGPVASWTQGSGQGYARSFDQDGRLTGISIGGVTTETVALSYDSAGRITGISDALAAPRISNSGTTDFQYGSTSNRQTGSTGGMTKTYTYDAAGNITGDGSATFSYDARGRLTQVTKGSVTQYAINGLGQRVAKTTTTPGAIGGANTVSAVYFVYDEAGHLLGEYDGTGTVIQETVWLGDLPVGVLTSGGQYYVNPDHLGAPLTVTDATGQIVWRWDRDPYGNGKPNENPSGVGTFTYNLRFPGQYYDRETELHYNYFRDYNPKTGRYVQADPIGLDGGVNLYMYALGNSVSWSDPVGLWTVSGNAGFHVPTGPWPVSAGVSRDFASLNRTSEAVAGTFLDIGFSVGVADISGEGNQAGPSINFGIGKYAGVQITLRNDFDPNRIWLNPLKYLDGVSVGLGLGVGFPLNLTVPLKTSCDK
ncbi:RHS repeat-associated core domain-containing protein [Solidesulfovibrio sp.]|uniref:RHS repeat-associated core domain-containing protein n=1 Tax=Solidesulfovibrio sp. TaxID=2910990 RepID=UPI002B1E948E|nr:RHS repeat-associated core domain-containing protein [Solidesulfovibrio sp.]MEA4855005.1 RHS repeat-associated core domain-containing protein [Solidesulfovibrio sp.]